MNKIILAPDSFKGTLSAIQICDIMGKAIEARFPACKIVKIPVADGGEGTVDCFLSAIGGLRVETTVKNPYFEDISSFYAVVDNGRTAVIEMAAAAGLPLVEGRLNPALMTTFGVGQLILNAASKGVSKIVLGLGGSCTNDAGCGAAAALGVQFLDENGDGFIPVGETLSKIKKINTTNINSLLKGINISVMCDIDNPLYGENGAAFVFSPQKGATLEMVQSLDFGLVHVAQVIKECLGIDVSNINGSGAAGGMGAGMIAFLNATLSSGIETVLDVTKFNKLLDDCDLVFTGEGRIDSQSIHGKVVSGVAKAAKALEVPVCVVVGDIGDNFEAIYEIGVTAVFSINQRPLPFEEAKNFSATNLEKTMDNILRFLYFIDSSSRRIHD